MSLTEDLGFKRRDNPAAYARAWRARNAKKYRKYQNDYYHRVTKQDPEKLQAKLESGAHARRKAKYGISKAEFLDLLTQQEGKCKICGVEKGFALRVDHDHTTGAVRGLLCSNCNSGLGLFGDDPDRMRKAAEYAEAAQQEKG